MAGAKLIQQVFGIIQGRLVAKIVPNVINTLKKRIFGAIGELSVSFFTDKQTGGLMTRITQDATRVSDIFIDGIPFILPNLFTIIFSCYFMFSTNWILALTAIITLPPAVIISMKLSPVLWHYNSKMFQTSRNFRAKLNDNITGARVVRAFGRESSEAGRLDKSSGFIASSQLNAMRFDLKFTILYQLTKGLSPEEIKRAGLDTYFVDHTLGIYPVSAAGVPFDMKYVGIKGDIIADLNEDLAAEQKARVTYDNILRLVDDPDVRDPIKYLRQRELVHYQRFAEAIHTVSNRF
jgi:ABC-type multidrug transport system fused ATPase/permease subunit